ncbi:hypothetical protein GQ600_11404 [Phytophthora cactorum]|nr:hypothetical protein GQ600_11404 [Phytophthora cactorum]
MDGIGGSTTYFVSRHHEHPPATLEELLRVSSKPDSISKKTDSADVIRKRVPDADDADSDSDYQCGSEDSDGDIDSGEPELDEWRLHAAEPEKDCICTKCGASVVAWTRRRPNGCVGISKPNERGRPGLDAVLMNFIFPTALPAG